jgi:hypothetical protein
MKPTKAGVVSQMTNKNELIQEYVNNAINYRESDQRVTREVI